MYPLRWMEINFFIIFKFSFIIISMLLYSVHGESSSLPSMVARNDQMKDLLKNSAILLRNHLIDHSSSRATTSSQVIEYNARNIVLMTLLNSFLILGGLLGALNRHDPNGPLPFKRIDLSKMMLKRRIWKGRQSSSSNNGLHPPSPPPPVPHHLPSSTLHSLNDIPIESIKELNVLKPIMKPISGNLAELYPNNLDYEIFPRTFIKEARRRHDKDDSELSSSSPIPGTDNVENCAIIIQCTDAKSGKHYYPSLSSLTKTAVQLLNEDNHNERRRQRKPKSAMLDRVKEMVEIEQNKNTCHWKQLCQVDS